MQEMLCSVLTIFAGQEWGSERGHLHTHQGSRQGSKAASEGGRYPGVTPLLFPRNLVSMATKLGGGDKKSTNNMK